MVGDDEAREALAAPARELRDRRGRAGVASSARRARSSPAAGQVVVGGELLAQDRVAHPWASASVRPTPLSAVAISRPRPRTYASRRAAGGSMSCHLGDELLPLLGLEAAEDGMQQAGLADEQAPDGRRADVGLLRDALDGHRLVAVGDETRRPVSTMWIAVGERPSIHSSSGPCGSAPARGRPRLRGVPAGSVIGPGGRRRRRGRARGRIHVLDRCAVAHTVRIVLPGGAPRGAAHRSSTGGEDETDRIPSRAEARTARPGRTAASAASWQAS